MDDIVISRPEYASSSDTFHIVSNAGCREKVHTYITEELKRVKDSCRQISWDVLPDQGLIALQGPLSADILRDFLGPERSNFKFQPTIDLETFYFGQNKIATVTGLPNDEQSEILISRAGYTGEDGFELSIPPAHTATIAKHLVKTAGPERLKLAGLGARDSLRLEAGLCLYGQDLDDSTTPVEAGLGWIVHRDRRESGGFYGDKVILNQLKQPRQGGGPLRRRVGMMVTMRPARTGAEILAPEVTQPEVVQSSKVNEQSTASEAFESNDQPRKVVGTVTSGCPSPTLGQNIAMGYVQLEYSRPGTELRVMVGGKERKTIVKKLPFVEPKLWKSPDSPKPNLVQPTQSM